MAIDEVLFARLRDNFNAEWRKIEPYASRRPLTKNEALRANYRKDIVGTFNSICNYLIQIYHSSDKIEEKLECVARINPYIIKCQKAFDILRLQYVWPTEELTPINIDLVISIDGTVEQVTEEPEQPTGTDQQGDIASSTGNSEQFFDTDQANDSRIDELISNLSNLGTVTEVDLDQSEQIDNPEDQSSIEQITEQADQQTNQQIIEQTVQVQTGNTGTEQQNNNGNEGDSDTVHSQPTNRTDNTMPQTPEEFVKTASHILNYKFEGDPLKLQSFLEDIDLVQAMAKPESKDVCLKFVKTRITGRAREVLPDDIDTIKKITDALVKNIKADNSTVIEGRITALRIHKGNMTKFAEEAEKLAEAFERSLVSEKFTKEKAEELTVLKTKELCRKVARNDVVEGIIASTKFASPKDVIATFITENDIARKKKSEQQNYQKRSGDKYQSKGQKFNKANKNYKNDGKGQNKGKYNKNRNNSNQSGKSRGNRNEHTIRIVSDATTPSTSAENSTNGGEQVFRLNQS